MADPKGEGLKLGFDGSLRLAFHGAKVTSDAGLLAYRDLDEALALFDSVPSVFYDSRTGRNIQHDLTALLRQSVYSRLAGYEDVNDAHRLSVDPTMRRITGKKLDDKNAASANTMGRFETKMLSVKDNLKALSEVNGRWVERALQKTTHRRIILDMDSSASPVHGQQEASGYNGHFGCTCYHPLFCFNQFGDCEGSLLRPGNVHSADRWKELLEPIVARYEKKTVRKYFRGDAAFAKPEIYEYLEEKGVFVCYPASRQPGASRKDSTPADPACGASTQKARRLVGRFQIPSRQLETGSSGHCQGRVASRRTLSESRFHRDQ